MKKNELKYEILNLLLDDNDSISLNRINYYISEIIKELLICNITFKSVDEISLHEFECFSKNSKGVYIHYFSLLVSVIYNGDFEHSFTVFCSK